MDDIEEKRVYDDREGREVVLVATGTGLVTVSVSGGLVGEFGLHHRCNARAVAAGGGHVAVATDEDVLYGPVETGTDGGSAVGPLEEREFGPATAVDLDAEGRPLAAGEGRVARSDAEGSWQELGDAGPVRAVDGDLLAAADGIHRVADGLPHVGLDDAHDVATAGEPLAAIERGLYRLGNGWMREHDDRTRVVASDGHRAHAATDGGLYTATRRETGGDASGGGADGDADADGAEWRRIDLPVDGRIAAIDHGESVYVATADGTLLVGTDGEWRSQALGVPDVGGIAVV